MTGTHLRPYQTTDNPRVRMGLSYRRELLLQLRVGVTQVWLDNDAHGRSATNPGFLTMYWMRIANDKTGRHGATDSPLRQLILLVQANDGQGQALLLVAGPTVPAWGGVGDPARGYCAGLSGKGFSKVLEELS